MKNITNKTIGEIVATDYRTTEVFKKYDIDFCCNGNRSIEDACLQTGIDPNTIWHDIETILKLSSDKNDTLSDHQSWPLDLLADYIEKRHHRFVIEQIQVLENYLEKLCNAHSTHHPELLKIRSLFHDSANELTMHMKKEEQILFPYIRKIAMISQTQNELLKLPFGTVQSPIRNMMHEHTTEGERFREINKLSNGYTAPDDGCNTYHLAFTLLKDFEADLHLHIHLENNILFPKAIEMEQQLLSKQ